MQSSMLVMNGTPTGHRISWKRTASGPLFDIAALMEAVGGRCTLMLLHMGVVAQYGKRFGFAATGAPWGMVQMKLCAMEPPLVGEPGSLWAPTAFVATILDGKVTLDEERDALEITAPPPLAIGDVVPEAKQLHGALESRGFTVLQGEMCLTDAIDVCFAGYSPNANGNNAGAPYLCAEVPLPPGAAHAPVNPPTYTLREDEGLVLIGKTPPACIYYSFRSYLVNRCLSTENPLNRKKIYTQLGDPINAYNIDQDIFYPPEASKVDDRFGSFFVLVSTADRTLYQDVLQAVEDAGLDRGKVLLDVIDPSLVRLGNDDFADALNLLHRFTAGKEQPARETYAERPPIEVLRVTPKERRKASFLEPFPPRQRGTGTKEDKLRPALEKLRQAILRHYSPTHYIHELDTRVWLGDSGKAAIDKLEDVLGETRDTLYLRTDDFPFDEDTIVVTYGVNHKKTGKAQYTSMSCYGARYFNGFGGITNRDCRKSVERHFPELEGAPGMNKLYVWKFARKKVGRDTCVVPPDALRNLRGIDYGETAFMGFRSYIDEGSSDLLGPDPGEILFDRAIVLRPIRRSS